MIKTHLRLLALLLTPLVLASCGSYNGVEVRNLTGRGVNVAVVDVFSDGTSASRSNGFMQPNAVFQYRPRTGWRGDTIRRRVVLGSARPGSDEPITLTLDVPQNRDIYFDLLLDNNDLIAVENRERRFESR